MSGVGTGQSTRLQDRLKVYQRDHEKLVQTCQKQKDNIGQNEKVIERLEKEN